MNQRTNILKRLCKISKKNVRNIEVDVLMVLIELNQLRKSIRKNLIRNKEGINLISQQLFKDFSKELKVKENKKV